MIHIPLSRGQFALISACDVELVAARSWSATPRCASNGGFYAAGAEKGRTVYMHRQILSAAAGQIVDHINGDGLDNRRENLRFANRSLNNVNRRGYTPISGFRGVYPEPSGRFTARIWVNGRSIHGGRHATAELAAVKYDELAAQHFGDFAVLNFARAA